MEQQNGKTAKDLSGYLFPNKKTNDRQPDFRGKFTINGKEYLLSGWSRAKDGDNMITIQATDPATLPPKTGGSGGGFGAGQGGSAPRSAPAAGAPAAFSRPAAGPAPAAGAKNPKDEGYPDLDDLDSLFDGVE